jgi:opacity protein-like surface antigen
MLHGIVSNLTTTTNVFLMNMKTMVAGAGIACLVSALSANAGDRPFRHFDSPSTYNSAPAAKYTAPTNDSTIYGLKYGFGITGIYGTSSAKISEIDFDFPDLAGAIVDFHIDVPTETVTHEFSFNLGFMTGDESKSYGPDRLKLDHDSTTVTVGYKLIIPTSDVVDIYVGAKLGASYNKFEEKYSDEFGSESETFHHDCFTASVLAGLRFNVSERVNINVGYELYIPTGDWYEEEGFSISTKPYHCVTFGVGVNF